MKKVLAVVVLAAATFGALLLASCTKKDGGGTAAASEPKSIRVFNIKGEIDAYLKEFAADYEKRTGTKVTIETYGGGVGGDMLKGYKAADNMPDTFVFEGPGHFAVWKDDMVTLDDEPWVKDTQAAYKADGHVYGFPYAVEGYGMAYNADLLEKGGVDPASLTTVDAYREAFQKLDAQKDTLGIDSVVSMSAGVSAGMTWVTGTHNFGVYLSAGLPAGDEHVIEMALKGQVDEARLKEFAEYVKLIFDYSKPDILLNGTYDQQLQAFTDQKAVFLHQGNWADPTITEAGASFRMAYAPHAFTHSPIDGVQVGAPSWWAVCKTGDVDEAKKFLTDFATSSEGRKARIERMALISPFTSDTIKPTTPLSASIADYVSRGKTYPWEQFKMPDGFTQDTLGPIYELLAQGSIDTDGFVNMVQSAIATIGK